MQYLKILLIILFVSPVFAQSEFRTYDMYSERKKADEDWKRYFVIGTNVANWAGSPGAAPNGKNCTQNEFNSAKEIFNFLYCVYAPTSGVTGTPLPSYINVDGTDCVLVGGYDHLAWWMRSRSEYNAYNAGDNDPMGPTDMATAASKLTAGTAPNRDIDKILGNITTNGFDGRGDFIHYIMDEPERGFQSWYFPNDILNTYYQEINSDIYTLGYIDLGPINGNTSPYNGNHYIYNLDPFMKGLTIPSNNELLYEHDYYESMGDDFATLNQVVNYYKNSCDVIGINSYWDYSIDPKKIGTFVTWLHSLTNNKPVWIWISSNPDHYQKESIDSNMIEKMREQAYSAVIHRVAGINFWGERTNSKSEWDNVLDIVRELRSYEGILEVRNNYDHNYNWPIEWKTVRIADLNRYITFAYNTENVYNTVSCPSGIGPLSLGPYECGVWTKSNDDSQRKLKCAKNLSFEKSIEGTTYPPYYNWIAYKNGGTIISENINPRTGNNSLRVYHPNNHCAVEQFFDCIPGLEYEITGWYRSAGSPNRSQYLILQFYNDSGWMSETSRVYTPGYTASYIKKTISAVAPAGAKKIKIHIGTQANKGGNGRWDDILVRIKGIPGEFGGLSKSLVTSESQHTKMFTLYNNYPNPFNPITTINFDLPTNMQVRMSIYDIKGRVVKTLINHEMQAGSHSIQWDGTNDEALKVTTGIYLCRLEAGTFTKTLKMSLIK